ncbi:HAD family hydrolase [Rhizobium leucaenae]|uniref:Phosphoglycolate phosphatase n=1 Tax=Rhizobium leucaenae TaxID=29450 RepID=A0A7W6ZW37_9HYPH|nr:HAD family hydrolase [Rhizobium leucaenae]MBB4569781.1 phosphoglycolate phosphatase [Rhizobium leucaenae]MBB6299706.1 phosphoglycolate phosphatase [Rhizobium leucaenae]
MKSPLVVFDLDGTLIDTAPDLIASLNHTIASLDLAPVNYENLTHLVGHGAQAMIERACRLRGHPLESGDLPPLLQRFIAFYTDTMPGDSKPFPGILNAMDALKAAGFGLAVCTNKLEKLAVTLIERLNLTHYFDVITGGDTFTVRKPDAQHLIGTIERAGGTLSRTVMVGDSANDILVAHNAGVPSIAVPFGYSDVGVETLGPSRVIAHYDELTPDLVRGLLAA